ncbi:Para-aminobenzoate synthase component 1 [Anaerohalosphaera lusitana]|uniref:aminodeoxychorismate synthase n=1 Tax=Anaerohalosphaera lusitana TaxID=1936003 RepID=A0A1U9NIJ0_9BACT|nr:aminodeoxychorismate synthase component I [Anaerohalosphaera lusitana]AQT67749.1 Para-aminobenzoate synthase component 1 [Anaerohalosphaera lusitana]
MKNCKVKIKRVEFAAELEGVTEVFAKLDGAAVLGGNEGGCGANRFSAWMAEPVEIFEFRLGEDDPFGRLESVLGKYKLSGPMPEDLPAGMFACGWVGFFGYELGRYIESIPDTAVDDLGLPVVRLGFYDRAVCYDHVNREWYAAAGEFEGEEWTAEEKFRELEKLIERSCECRAATDADADMEGVEPANIECNISRREYFDAFERIKEYIHDGDVYQINFSQRFRCDYAADPVKLYQWQNRHNPSPYAAFIKGEEWSVVSASPELFVRVQDGKISTKPIKGTRARVSGADAERINKKHFDQLAGCEKEQAELNMIIDLERNDLTRVCRYGTIKVVQPRTIEAYPTVYHAVATVEGELREKQGRGTVCDILRAMFPGGSITGAPKIRSMEIIDELEPTARSVYTGSIGFIGLDGSACLNIAIRTVIIRGNSAYVQTGGGVVADSQPQAEWDETITKARALLAGIAAVGRTRVSDPEIKDGK